MSRARWCAPALALALAFAGARGAVADDIAGPPAPRVPRTFRSLVVPTVRPRWSAFAPDRGDLAFAAGVTLATAVAWHNDLPWSRHVAAHDTPAQVRLANFVQPLGQPVAIGAGALAWGVAWWVGRPGLMHAAQRADLAMLAAGATTIAIKEAVGRERPDESPGDATVFHPFTSHDAFPSGHATLAFAAATVLDRETRARWVPMVAYPAAGLVAWSRLHDRRHWTSDVLAGAAIGFGVAWKTEDALRAGAGVSRTATGARLELDAGDGALAALRLRF
jgi:membrane-associated phospholipid phosphatase